MNFRSYLILILAFSFLVTTGCSGGGGDPLQPPVSGDLPPVKAPSIASNTHLWGYYEITLDTTSGEVSVVPSRDVMFTANVVNFLNANPSNLGFSINGIYPEDDWLDIDIDISITHPFPGLPRYHGYDVRGVFMGNGMYPMKYNPDLNRALFYTEQYMLADPVDGYGGPDGYTRWFNVSEFSEGGMPLFQYTEGKAASPGYLGSAEINPYKYFADSLGTTEDLWSWLDGHADQNGQFSSGATNDRNYYIRFPDQDIKFAYAIIADWAGPELEDHPGNAPEPIALSVIDQSDVWFTESPNALGGNLNLDISVWDWDAQLTSTVMVDYTIFMQSSVLQDVHQFDSSEMTPISGTENYSTYHIDIPADIYVLGSDFHEVWVIIEENGADYSNEFGAQNLAWDDPLAAFFRYNLEIGTGPENTPPVINDITDDIDPDGLNISVSDKNTAVTYICDFTDPDTGQSHTITWFIEDALATEPSDPPDDMPYDWSLKDLGEYKIWVKVDDGFDEVTAGPWDINKVPLGWVMTWGAGYQDRGYGLAVDSQDNIYVCGNYYYSVDFDPDPEDEDVQPSSGNRDSFLSKFDSTGDFQWARTWGDNVSFGGGAGDLKIDADDNIYVGGYFYGTVDFDPGPGEEIYSYHEDGGEGDGSDAYLTKFDPDGNHLWARTWGGASWLGDTVLGVAIDDLGDVYVTGGYLETCDFDPDPVDEEIKNSLNDYRDIYISKFDPSGDFQWVQVFGGPYDDYSFGMNDDLNGDIYFVGRYYQDCDFDPGPGEEIYNSLSDGNSFLTKFDSDGVWQYVKVYGSGDAFRLGINSSNDVVVSGVFGGTAQFDPDGGTASITANGKRDCYLNVFDETGAWQWVTTWESIAMEDTTSGYIGHHVIIDDDDYIYSTAHFTGTADLDPDPVDEDPHTSNGLRDCFVSKFDPAGDHVWSRTWGGESTDDGGGIGVDSNGNIYGTGWFYGTVDFDPGDDVYEVTSNGSLDVFLIQLNSDGYW